MERELFSKGMHAKVYSVTDRQKILFPGADLVRAQYSENPFNHKQLFYKHRIAQLLYPDNFIEVVGAVSEERDQSWNGLGRDDLLFSKKAHVPDEHAIFAAHMGIDDNGPRRLKRSLCSCEACVSHKAFHEQHDITMRALEDSGEFMRRGIIVPWDDDSDYCVTDTGNLLYFEIDRFDWRVLQNNISDVQDSIVHTTIERMAQRYEEYFQLSLERIRRL